jgi:prepilin-type N-terminal cleavage/methylation domain-containing protein
MSALNPIQRRTPQPRRGFTLIEAAMAMVIIGLAVGSMLQLLAAGTQSNMAGGEMTTAINLTKNIREISSGLSFTDPNTPGSTNTNRNNLAQANDIWDLDGLSLNPPVDCRGLAIDNYGTWTQKISVQTVSLNGLSSTRPSDATVPTARITVTITHSGRTVYQSSWLTCAPNTGM